MGRVIFLRELLKINNESNNAPSTLYDPKFVVRQGYFEKQIFLHAIMFVYNFCMKIFKSCLKSLTGYFSMDMRFAHNPWTIPHVLSPTPNYMPVVCGAYPVLFLNFSF